MSSEHPQSLRLLETALWVLAVTGVVVAVAVVLGSAMGGLTIAKQLLFVVGVLLFGVSSFLLRPKPPEKDDDGLSAEEFGESRIEAAINEVPPLRDATIPIDQRVNRNVKLFLTGLAVLAVSFLMETVLGIKP